MSHKIISVTAPAYNEEKNIPLLYEQVCATVESTGHKVELVIVENGSTDTSLEILQKLHKNDPRIQYVSLSRNFGHQGALIAGIEHCHGDAVICMDGDLQHPPSIIPELIKKWQEGFDIVFAIKNEYGKQPLTRKLFDRIFYRLISALSILPLSNAQSDFRLMDRKAATALITLPEHNKFLRGLSRWIGFKQTEVTYQPASRGYGKSKFRLFDLINFAVVGLTSFSLLPLRLFTMLGMCIAITASFYGFFALILGLYKYASGGQMDIPMGWSALASGIFFLGGVQLIGVGVLGEYLGRIFEESKRRPAYIVQEKTIEAFNEKI